MVSIGQLLNNSSLELSSVHVPQPETAIRWVATSELPNPAPFLEGGEVLLTTGLEMRGWRSQWTAYVERLGARQVVAIGFATGLTHRQVPSGLVAACEAIDANLFEVPRKTPFVAISRAVADLLDADAERAARTSLRDQQALTQAALRPDPAEAVVNRLASLLDGAAALVGDDQVAPVGPDRDAFDLELVTREVERIRPQGLRAAASVQVGSGTLTVQPIGTTGIPTTYLAAQVRARLSDADRVAITTAVALLSLAAQTRAVRRDTDRSLRRRAFELLLEGDARTAALVLGTTVAGAPQMRGNLVVGRAAGPARALRDGVALAERQAHVATMAGDEVWFIDRVRQADGLAQSLSGLGLTVGLGDPTAVADVRSSWVSAGHALASATEAHPVVAWQEVLREGPLAMLDPERAEAFASSFVGRIGDELLIETLRSFVRHHGSRLKVAQELGIHRNTVSNRVHQIEELIGGSLDDPRMRVAAWISLQVTTIEE